MCEEMKCGGKSEIMNVGAGVVVVVVVVVGTVNELMRKVAAMEGGAAEEKEVPMRECASQNYRHASSLSKLSCSSSSFVLGF